MSQPSRRDFLKVATSYMIGFAGLLGLVGVAKFLSYSSAPPQRTEFDLGPVDAFPVGSRIRNEAIPALIVRTSSGFSALSLRCTHLGCTVDEDADGFRCPCHGSRYDSDGNVTRGPAPRALSKLRTETTEQGTLVVHTV